MGKVDRNVQLETLRRPCFVRGIPVRKPNRSPQYEIRYRSAVFDGSRALNRVEKWRRTSVHDRRLRPVQVDQQIVNVRPVYGCEDMLDRVNRYWIGAELGPSLGEQCSLDARRDLRGIRQIRPAEHDAESRRRRLKGQPNLDPQAESHTLESDRPTDGPSLHGRTLASTSCMRRSSGRRSLASLKSAACERSASLCGRAGYPDQVSPAGTSPNTPACPPKRAPRPMVVRPPTPTSPTRM